ncbi:MAG TPA: hypothetical protein PKH07_09930, partial [bacterium]|nr:hypothetical protein [bacterium]
MNQAIGLPFWGIVTRVRLGLSMMIWMLFCHYSPRNKQVAGAKNSMLASTTAIGFSPSLDMVGGLWHDQNQVHGGKLRYERGLED